MSIQPIPRAVLKLFQDPDRLQNDTTLSPDEKIRLRYFSIFLLLGVSTMAVLVLENLMEKQYLLMTLIFLSATGLVVGWILLRRLKYIKTIYRVNALLYSLTILYGLTVDDHSGRMLWIFTFPLIFFFLFGKREGMVWNLVVFSALSILIINPFSLSFGYEFPFGLIARIITTYIIVSALAHWFEFQRVRYRVDSENKNRLLELEIKKREKAQNERERLIEELQDALAHVKTLSGLLPICSNCKKIRDDKGYWNRIEGYIQEHSQAKFSHSICPECARELYPEFDIYKEDTGT